MLQRAIIILLLFLFLKNSGNENNSAKKYSEEGYASFYAEGFHGKKTASGELFNMADYTAAHRTLAFGTYLRVTNLKNNYTIIVRVNDRGPFSKNRIIDLTEGAARRIGSYKHGVVRVKVEEIDLLQITPELDSIFNCNSVTDCLGNSETLSGFSLSLWRSEDLLHTIYIANDLYLKEDVEKVYIVTKASAGLKKYHVAISGIENRVLANELKNYFENQGYLNVRLIK
ncbi:MAG TPA: septal ring lytic transglycosylase RlpA family protein [Bacteroidia bacterium]|nr:septal ring lytic transglycosylase RlpA family protein [Bacteroidia bacterium]